MTPEIRNHMKKELPLIRPKMPPARPKKNMMTSRPMPTLGLVLPDECLDCPEDRKHRRDHDHRPEDRDHEPDDDLQEQRSRSYQHDAGECLANDRRTRPR